MLANMCTNIVFRIIEAAQNMDEDKCCRYASKLYDHLKVEENDFTKDEFLEICHDYFHKEEVSWAVQD